MKLNKVFSCLTITFGLLFAGQSYADNSMDKEMDRMQDHWRMMMNEKDEGKRKSMMMDHKMMMDEIDKSNITQNHHMGGKDHHMGDMSGDHMHMMNMMDMHRSMMDMMD